MLCLGRVWLAGSAEPGPRALAKTSLHSCGSATGQEVSGDSAPCPLEVLWPLFCDLMPVKAAVQ